MPFATSGDVLRRKGGEGAPWVGRARASGARVGVKPGEEGSGRCGGVRTCWGRSARACPGGSAAEARASLASAAAAALLAQGQECEEAAQRAGDKQDQTAAGGGASKKEERRYPCR